MSQIITHSGRLVDVLNPGAEDMDIEDIAHALSNICRWCGHCRYFYSVAQHSVIVSRHVPPEHALWGLLHDAAEAYLMDMPTPIKRLLPGYAGLESGMQAVVAARFDMAVECPASVKVVDKRLQVTEAIELGLRPHIWDGFFCDPLPVIIAPMPPGVAYTEFMRRFRELRDHG